MPTNTASAQPRDPLLEKAVGGRYVIERLIGRGGVGLVYLAEDKIDGSQVVVKVLAPHWAEDRDAVARFDREALRMAELKHPNVVEMYDHGHFEGRAYIVMEFIRGEPLRRYLGRRKRMTLEEFVPVAAQILDGAGYVHARGIMLRDIKPPNIMLCELGGSANHVKLLDFGLAKLIEEDEDDEVTKAHVIGTAAYMSPEQIKGERIDVRVDVYALGVLFFLMLTGEQPIAGDNDAAVLVNHVHGIPKSLAERLPKDHRIPAELIAFIESCLAKSPSDRPADAGAMAKRLREILPASLFELPSANLKTRAPAEAYWAARLHSGPAAVAALESDGNDSAEWTRPLLRRAAQTGESPLKLAEAEIAAQKKAWAASSGAKGTGSGVRPLPASSSGSGVRPLPASSSGSGVRPKPPVPGSGVRPLPSASSGSGVRPMPGSGSGSGAVPRPKPPVPGSGVRPLPAASSGSGVRPMPGGSAGSGVRPMPAGSAGSGVRPVPGGSAGSGVRPMPSTSAGSGAVPRPKPPAPPPPPPAKRTTSLASPPGASTIRVTAADAKEAVAKLEEELEASRSSMRTLIPGTAPAEAGSAAAGGEDDPLADKPTLVPTKAPTGASAAAAAPADASSSDRRTLVPTTKPKGPGSAPSNVSTDSFPIVEMAKTGRRSSVPPLDPAELDPDAEDSDLLPIAVDDDDADDSRPSLSRPSAIAPTLSTDPVATDALSVLKPIPLPPRRPAADGMRWGAIVAIAGLVALTLGGLSAWIVLDGDEDPSTPAPTATADATPASTTAAVAGTPAGSGTATATPANPTAGLVEIRAIAGARVEVDGEDRGEAPVSLELPLGEHRVRVAAPSHHPWQTTIDVKAGANAAVTAELVPMDTVVVVPPTGGETKSGGETKPRPKSGGGTSKPKPDAKVEPEPKPKDDPKPKPKPDVFMDSNKGKDDGIFLPVGGK